MLYFNKMTFLKELMLIRQVNKKECDICHYRHILDRGFKFPPDICSVYLDLLMMSVNLSDISVLN